MISQQLVVTDSSNQSVTGIGAVSNVSAAPTGGNITQCALTSSQQEILLTTLRYTQFFYMKCSQIPKTFYQIQRCCGAFSPLKIKTIMYFSQ